MVFNIFAPLKGRRNYIIEKHIQEVVRSGKDFIVYDNIYFESGRAYAIEKGAKAADSTSASAHVLVDGKDYFVVFSKAASGGLIIGTEDTQNVKERLLDPSKMHEHLDKELKNAFDEFDTEAHYDEAEQHAVEDQTAGAAPDKQSEEQSDLIAHRYPPNNDGSPDTIKTIVDDAMRALAEMNELFKEANEAKKLCNQIGDYEQVPSKPMFELFVSLVEDNFQAVLTKTVQVRTKIIDAINRMVLLHSDVSEGEGKEALKDLVANLRVSVDKMSELHAEMADGIEQVVFPAMRRAKGVDIAEKQLKKEEVEEIKFDITDIQVLRKLATEQGDAAAQFFLGMNYVYGQSIQQDYKTAFKWLTLAAEQGFARAQYALGTMYAEGRDVPQDHMAALKWFTLAAEQGDASAQYILGMMYGRGQGVPQDYMAAFKWFTLAAEQGHASAQFILGTMYAEGRGVPQDDMTALKWLTLAAGQGDAAAQNYLGAIYEKGQGVPQDDMTAIKWFTLAAEQGDANAQSNLDVMNQKG